MPELTLKVNLAPTVQVEATAADARQAMRGIGELVMMFQHGPCGNPNCGSDRVVPVHKRTKQGYDYYYLQCSKCSWEFNFGQRQSDGALFPKESEGWQAPYQGGSGGEHGGDQYQQGGNAQDTGQPGW